MKTGFNLQPTEEEFAFARRRFLSAVERINEQSPINFATYWNLTNGGEQKILHAQELDNLCRLHWCNAILLGERNEDAAAWNYVVSENRRWVASLTAKQKATLKEFDSYKHWHPALLNSDPMSINGYLKLFPNIASAQETPPIIYKYENPKSPDKLPGAVEIDTHDSIHTLLGRGALQADEAFVIGFTMGGASNELTDEQADFFADLMVHHYPPPYNVPADKIIAYHEGVKAGRKYFAETGIDLSKFDFEPYRDEPISNLRAALGLDVTALESIYANLDENQLPAGRGTRNAARPRILDMPNARPWG